MLGIFDLPFKLKISRACASLSRYIWHFFVRHLGSSANSLENKASFSNGSAGLAALNLLKLVSYFILTIFRLVLCTFCFVAVVTYFLESIREIFGTRDKIWVDIGSVPVFKALELFLTNAWNQLRKFMYILAKPSFVPAVINFSPQNGLIGNNLDVITALYLEKSLLFEELSSWLFVFVFCCLFFFCYFI